MENVHATLHNYLARLRPLLPPWSSQTQTILAGLSALDHKSSLILSILSNLDAKVSQMSAALDSAIALLVADNATLKAELADAPNSIATLIATAIAAQANSGVTAAQLQSLADLHTALSGDATELTAALAGTPPAPPVADPAPPVDVPPIDVPPVVA